MTNQPDEHLMSCFLSTDWTADHETQLNELPLSEKNGFLDAATKQYIEWLESEAEFTQPEGDSLQNNCMQAAIEHIAAL